MKIITHHIKKNTLKIWDTKNIDKFKQSLEVNRPGAKGSIDYYRVLDFTTAIRGSDFEIVKNEIITKESYSEQIKGESELKPWYEIDLIDRKKVYDEIEQRNIMEIERGYSNRWYSIEHGTLPRPDDYPVVPAKRIKVYNHVSKIRELQRIKVIEV
tara:strand:- start:635 stop:1102 length:468 start_codon:yes stop_codon:yes gene_type:complete